MRKFYYFMAVVAVAITSCQQEVVYKDVSSDKIENETMSPFVVTEQEALENLEEFMAAFDGPETRSHKRSIKKVDKVSLAIEGTRSYSDDIEGLIYIAEFENGEGSAILGADRRLESVYAVFDETVLTQEDFDNAVEGVNLNDVSTFAAGIIVDNVRRSRIAINDSLVLTPPGGGGDDFRTYWYDYVNATTILNYLPPLLNTRWSQFGVFNDMFPLNMNSNDGRQAAGCTTIALGQILNHNGCPSPIDLNGNRFYWRDINQFTWDNNVQDEDLKTKIAKYIFHLSEELNVEYDVENVSTSSNILSVRRVMRRLGYTNFSIDGITESVVYPMLYNNKPLYTRGETVNGDGHGWVVDGWKTVVVRNICITYDNNIEISREVLSSTTTNYIHCNMGWGGKCNGYYTLNLFDTTRPRTEDELESGDLSDTAESYIYTTDFKTLSYNY